MIFCTDACGGKELHVFQFRGETVVDFDRDELAMLADMVEGAILSTIEAGDEPSDTARAVWRKVLILQSIGEVSSQRARLRGGDFLDPRVVSVERRQEEIREGQENTTACPLTRA